MWCVNPILSQMYEWIDNNVQEIFSWICKECTHDSQQQEDKGRENLSRFYSRETIMSFKFGIFEYMSVTFIFSSLSI